jgi:hypothetical protein
MTADKSGNVYAVGADSIDYGTLYLREKPASSAAWTTMATMNEGDWGEFNDVAVDAAGDVFITGRSNPGKNIPSYFTTWELAEGTTTLKQIDADTAAPGAGGAVTVDGSGNVYVVGGDDTKYKGSTVSKWTVRKGTYANGKWSFSTVDQPLQSKGGTGAVAVTPTGIYVGGAYNGVWTIRRSATGASGTWTTVDSWSGGNYGPGGIATDAAGNIYAVGVSAGHWIVRESTNGGSSWTTVDDFIGTLSYASASAITRDASGNMVVAGWGWDSVGDDHAVVRTNAGGSWTTLDNYSYPDGNADYSAVAADTSGNLYAGGEVWDNAGTFDDWMIRSQPAAPKNLTAAADTTNPTSQINLSWVNPTGADATGFEIFRSTDGVNFTAIGTVDANTTIFADDTVSPGTTYYYYVVTLLNSDGSSNPSNTVTAST